MAAEQLGNGATRLALELAGEASTCALWPHAFLFRLTVEVGSEPKLDLTAENRSAQAAPFAFAFHTYFAVPDVAEASVTGLEGVSFIDKMDHFTRKQQEGEVRISAVTDRIYLDMPVRQTLKTSAGDVRIESDASCSVVWNAWTNDRTIADLGEGHHIGYLRVERCDGADRAVALPPGGSYRMRMALSY